MRAYQENSPNPGSNLLDRLKISGKLDDLFLITPTEELRYHDLLSYTEELKNPISSSAESVTMMNPELNKDDLFRLAAHLLTGRPVLLLPPSRKSNSALSSQQFLATIPELTEPDISVYLFTSGTSTSSKCVPIRFSQMEAASNGAKSLFAPDPNKAWLLNLPLYHVGGLSILARSLYWQTAIYLPDSRQIEETHSLLESEKRIQTVSLVYTQWKRLLESGVKPHPEIKAILLGGGPIPESYLKELSLNEASLPPLYNSYGMTESFAMISCRDLRDFSIIGNVGYSLSDQQIRIHTQGEIELKGSQIFDGYAPLSGEPAPPYPFTEDGWFKTGDFGKLESDGSLSVLSRRTDLIVSGGKNIVPQEVESELATLPYVQEVAVTGVPDEEWGEIVVALVRLAPALSQNHSLVSSSEFSISTDLVSATESELTQRIRGEESLKLERYRLPKRVLIVDELPRTELGKLKRSELKEWAKQRILPS